MKTYQSFEAAKSNEEKKKLRASILEAIDYLNESSKGVKNKNLYLAKSEEFTKKSEEYNKLMVDFAKLQGELKERLSQERDKDKSLETLQSSLKKKEEEAKKAAKVSGG